MGILVFARWLQQFNQFNIKVDGGGKMQTNMKIVFAKFWYFIYHSLT